MLAKPTEPELYTYSNGITVIRYPFKKTVRTFKLGSGIPEAEQQRRLKEFKKEYAQTYNGKGTALVVVPQQTDKRRKDQPAYLAGKTPEEADAIRAHRNDRAKQLRSERQGNGAAHHADHHSGTGGDDTFAELNDHLGVIIANVQSISTSLRMLQNKLTMLNTKRVKRG